MNKENKPCPFCGSNDLFLEYFDDAYVYRIICGECATESPPANTLKEAWEKWNKRRAEDDKHSS